MPITNKAIYETISSALKRTEQALKEMSEKQNAPCIITSSLVKRDEDAIGFISCFPHGDRAEDSLDGLILVSEKQDSIILEVEVAWSDGRVVSDIGKVTMTANDESNKIIWTNLVAQLTDVMSKTLIQIIK